MMELFCTAIILCIVVYLIYKISAEWNSVTKADHDAKEKRIFQLSNELARSKKKVSADETSFSEYLGSFFSDNNHYHSSDYSSGYRNLCQIISSTTEDLSKMKRLNEKFSLISPSCSEKEFIERIENHFIPWAYQTADNFKLFGERVSTLQDGQIVDRTAYGKINKTYLAHLHQLTQEDVMEYINKCYSALTNKDFEKIILLDANKILDCVLFFAIEPNFSNQAFKRGQWVFSRIYKEICCDFIVADLYVTKRCLGESAICAQLPTIINKFDNSSLLPTLASSLHCMGAFSAEQKVRLHFDTGDALGINWNGNAVDQTIPFSCMMDEANYGQVNKNYLQKITSMEHDEANNYISNCNLWKNNPFYYYNFSIDYNKVLECVWFFAIQNTFSASELQRASYVFGRDDKGILHVDIILANLYSKRKIGGEEVLHNFIRDIQSMQLDTRTLITLASGLMWMKAFEIERMVLQHMLTSGMEMPPKAQERLHSLNNNGGNAPAGFEISSSNSILYFDVSSLAWNDSEYNGLFENFAFQDKLLTYSLAVRDENKDLFIPQGINIPSIDAIEDKFRDTFAKEYGEEITIQSVNCVALSGSGEEKLDGILVMSTDCNQMGILIHTVKIGKKLILKFYTLFMPVGSDLSIQKQQALSMYKKLSPSVSMWERSLKDTMLLSIEQLLNATEKVSAPSHFNEGPATNKEPVF